MIKPIVYNIKELRKPCQDVLPEENVSQIMIDLKDTLYSLVGKGCGLADNQIGYNKKIAFIRLSLNKEHTEFKEYYLINPKILDKKGKIIFPEACLSFPGIIINILRYRFLIIENTTLKGQLETLILKDLEAVIVQHEIDHCHGRTLFVFNKNIKEINDIFYRRFSF